MDCLWENGRCVYCGWVNPTGDPDLHRNCPSPLALAPRDEAFQEVCQAICDRCEDGPVCRRCGCTSEREARHASRLRIGNCPRGKWPL